MNKANGKVSSAYPMGFGHIPLKAARDQGAMGLKWRKF